jgi:hypothetical protein
MYNTKIICTYHSTDVFLDTDRISDEDKAFIRDTIYRQELLNILGMEDYNEYEMNKTIHNLYNKVKECRELKECMIKLASHFMSMDEEFGLMLLFSYDYMHLTHVCVCELLETGDISEKNILLLKNILF